MAFLELERKRAALLVVNQFPNQTDILATMAESTCVVTGIKVVGCSDIYGMFNR